MCELGWVCLGTVSKFTPLWNRFDEGCTDLYHIASW